MISPSAFLSVTVVVEELDEPPLDAGALAVDFCDESPLEALEPGAASALSC